MNNYNAFYNNHVYANLADFIEYTLSRLGNFDNQQYLDLMVKIQNEAIWNCDEGDKPEYTQYEAKIIKYCYQAYSDFMELFGSIKHIV